MPFEGLHPAFLRVVKLDLRWIEMLCVKISACPVKHVVMLLVCRITQRLQERLVAPGSTTIFGRARALTTDASNSLRSIARNDLFKHDVVNPGIAEVIF